MMRGDVYDGRGFVKTATAGPTADPEAKRQPADVDLDMKLGAVVGFNGEALRGLDLKMSRRAGEIRSSRRSTPRSGATRTLHRRSARPRRRPPGRLSRDHGCRRAVPLHRHLSADDRRRRCGSRWIRPRPQSGAAGRHRSTCAISPSAAKPQLERAVARRAAGAQRNGVEFSAHAGRVHPHARHASRCATAWCAGR